MTVCLLTALRVDLKTEIIRLEVRVSDEFAHRTSNILSSLG